MKTGDVGSPLFYLAGATEGTTQWKVVTLQLVNWGGFHGYSTIDFSPGTTLLSGASGTGKSTLLDAYIALMMDSKVPFNGASNDATVGRARSSDQRSLISYLRGKMDTGRNAEGDLADQVLRGHNSATWGALAATFVDDNGRRFTITRLYYVPRAAVKDSDLTRKMCTVDGMVDLRDFASFAEGKFDKRAVEGRFPNLKMFTAYDEFSQIVFTRLGIGANGDGGKALRLLARIQAGYQVRTVDDLYKFMVIDLPGTYAAADDAVDHFKNLEDAYKAMETEHKKIQVLEGIPKWNDDRVKALEAIDLVDGLGIHATEDGPFRLWKLITEDALLEQAEANNREQRLTAKEKKSIVDKRHADLTAEHEVVEAALRQNESHALLAQLQEGVKRLGFDLASAEEQRGSFDQVTARIYVAIVTEEDFVAATLRSQTFIDDFEAVLDGHKEQEDALRQAIYEPSREKSELVRERESLANRDGRMDPLLHECRMIIAREAGIAPQSLPFVGELIDVLPEQRKWRKAIETTLLGLSRVLLIDADALDRVSRLIDPLALPRRVNFEGVDLGRFRPRDLDPRYVSGKLAYKDTPFSTWVQDRVSLDNTDALCVDSADQLGGRERRVTENGQTRKGRSGAHGESNAPHVIGFSKEERLAEIELRIRDLDNVLGGIDAQITALTRKFTALLADKTAHERVLTTRWRDIDSDGIQAEIAKLERRRHDILQSDDSLRELQDRLSELAVKLKTAGGEVHAAETTLKQLADEQVEIVTRKDHVVGEIQRIERGQAVTLTERQSAYLEDEFAQVATVGDLKDLTRGTARLKSRLAENRTRAKNEADNLERQLTAAFQRYLEDWRDPNLSASVENYPSFRRVLDTIVATGLHERRHEWAKRLTDWSGQDLVPLAGAFSHAIDDIRNRLAPVNAILARLPVGAKQHRLKIDLRELNRDDIVKFKRELKILSRADTDSFSDEQIQAWFKKLSRFMGVIRDDPSSKNNRDYFLDVRKHIEVTAVSYDSEGREKSTYAALGGKSGGESQELVAFIVGAALRFQLGDEAHERPRFAPVFLDEGFVKADSEFAGRSVAAWKGLGFQLVIGAPYGQFTALEPHADHVLYMAKSSKGLSSVKALPPAERVESRQKGASA